MAPVLVLTLKDIGLSVLVLSHWLIGRFARKTYRQAPCRAGFRICLNIDFARGAEKRSGGNLPGGSNGSAEICREKANFAEWRAANIPL